jgi:predicted HTH transcriptional regulator
MQSIDLLTLLSRPEGKTLEFKRDLSSPDGVLKAIVAFANTSGGVVLIGVEDGTRRVKGVSDVMAEEERLASLIADCIAPRLLPGLEVMPWRKTQVLAVEVHPSQNRPHYLKRLGQEEGVFVRMGSTNRRADAVLIEEMRRYTQAFSFDEEPLPDLNSEAIDFRAASEYFAPLRKLTPNELQSLKVTTIYGQDCTHGRRDSALRDQPAGPLSGCVGPGWPV